MGSKRNQEESSGMKERPILFSAPMVRAILSGQKTQTRRAYKVGNGGVWPNPNDRPGMQQATRNCPYGQPGDRLWVRETFMDLLGTGVEHRNADGIRQRYAFAAEFHPGSHADEARKDYGLKWKPSIHMPREASRITLEVTGVRVERLQHISETDAIAESIEQHKTGLWLPCREKGKAHIDPRLAYRDLWESINGVGSWDTNPWVWVVRFNRIRP